jgi:DNA polymerase-3 subunit beta
MKIEISVSQLRDSINKLLSVVDKKNARPILSNCLIESKNDKLILIATDLEVSAKIIIPAKSNTNGSFCINTKNLSDILRELPEKLLTLELNNNNLQLNCGEIKYNLLTVSTDEYPSINFESNDQKFKLKSKDLLNIINKTSHAISTDETRLYLNGIFLQQVDSKLRAVAIDGHRLALLDTNEIIGSNNHLLDGVIIPKKGINELKKIAETYPDQSLDLTINDSFLYISTDNYYINIRLISREYPKYQTVIPNKTTFKMKVERNTLLNAVKRIKLLSNEKTNGIKLSLAKNNLTLSANHPSLGQAVEKIDCFYDGNQMDIGFNAKYLIESINILPEEDIIFEFNNELTPVVVKSESIPEYIGIVMPLKL